MAVLTEEHHVEWARRRKITLITFVVQSCCLGMEYSVTFLTLWLYIKELVKPNNPQLYYGLISASYITGCVFFSVTLARFVDHTRNIKVTFLVGNACLIIGNLLYSLPYSPWCLICGRLIAGGGGLLRSIISAEIARCYPTDELASKFSAIGLSFAFGFTIGPGFNFVFKSLDINIFSWHVTYANVTGVYMAFLFIILFVLDVFFVYDLSKEYDLKQEIADEEDTERLRNNNESNSIELKYQGNDEESNLLLQESVKSSGTLSILLQLFRHADTCLLLCYSFFVLCFLVAFDIWIPLLVIDNLKWSLTAMNGIMLGSGCASGIILLMIVYKPLSDKSIFRLSVIASCALGVLELLFTTIKFYHSSMVFNVFVWVIFAVFNALALTIEEIFLIECMARMVSARIQTTVESIRLSFSRIGALLALLTSAYLLQWIEIVGSLFAGLAFLGAIMLIVRRKTLREPKIIIY